MSAKIEIIYVTNTNNDGVGSFRDAILEANKKNTSSSKIIFSVKGTIILEDSLPRINNTVLIDAISELHYTNYPLIEINCNNYNGIIFDKLSSYSSIFGLTIYNSNNNGITIYSSNITINNNFIFLNKSDGIYIDSKSNYNIIGHNLTLSSSYISNVISGNGGNGIQLNNSSYNTIIKNYI